MKRNALFKYVIPVGLLALLGVAAYYGERANDARHAAELRADVQQQLTQARDRLSNNLQSDLQLVQGLLGVIALKPDLDQKQFETAVRPLFATRTQLRNIAAAPDMVVRLIYPMAGNEKAIGLDYRTTPSQYAAAERARQTRRVVLAGPLRLVQGGDGLAARLPVFISGNDGRERFWGLVSAVIDSGRLFAASGINDQASQVEIAIRGKDARGPAGEVFIGRPQLFGKDAVLGDIPLPEGSWQLAAVPRGGWPRHADNVWTLRGVFAAVALLVMGGYGLFLYTLSKVSREREQAETLKRQLQATLEYAPSIAVQWYDAEGRVLYWNAASENMFGWSGVETLGQTVDGFIYDQEEADEFRRRLDDIASGGQPYGPYEHRVRSRDGAEIWLLSTLFGIPLAGGKQGFVRMDVDITERKQGEEQLRASRQLLDSIVENIPIMVFLKRASDLRFALFNRAGEALLGLHRDQLLGRNDYDFFPREQAEAFTTQDRHVLELGTVVDIPEEPIDTPNGKRILHTRKVALPDAQGRAKYLLGISEDITDRLESARRLAEHERVWTEAMNQFDDAIYILDDKRRLLRANRAFYALTGSAPEKLVGQHIARIIHHDSKAAPCPVCQAQEARQDAVLTLEADHPNNPAGRPIEVSIKVLRDADGASTGILVGLHDLSRERATRAELDKYRTQLEKLVADRTAALEDSNRRLAETEFAMDRVGIGIHWVDANTGRLIEVNDSACTMLGYSREEMLALGVSDIDPDFPQDQFAARTAFLRVEGTGRFETLNRHKDGHTLPVDRKSTRLNSSH